MPRSRRHLFVLQRKIRFEPHVQLLVQGLNFASSTRTAEPRVPGKSNQMIPVAYAAINKLGSQPYHILLSKFLASCKSSASAKTLGHNVCQGPAKSRGDF